MFAKALTVADVLVSSTQSAAGRRELVQMLHVHPFTDALLVGSPSPNYESCAWHAARTASNGI